MTPIIDCAEQGHRKEQSQGLTDYRGRSVGRCRRRKGLLMSDPRRGGEGEGLMVAATAPQWTR